MLKKISEQVESKGLIVKKTGTDALVDGVLIQQSGVYQIAMSFREPIVASSPRRLEISRASVSGAKEEASIWIPSKWKTWRRMSQALMQAILEYRMKSPSDQFTKIIVSFFGYVS